MGKIRSFRDDKSIESILESIPKNERSTIIRIALRRFFKEENLKGVISNDVQNSRDSQSEHQKL